MFFVHSRGGAVRSHSEPTLNNLLYVLQKFGPTFLYDITENLNSGRTQKEIAAAWNTDEATISRVINKFLATHYALKDLTLELVDAYSQIVMIKHERSRGEARIYKLGENRSEAKT